MTENPPPGRHKSSHVDAPDGQGRASGWFTRFLNVVEWLGNCLPHPVTLFALFALAIVLISGIAGYFEWGVDDPRPEGAAGRAEDGVIQAKSLMSGEGFRWIVEHLVTNFTGFVPLGTVLVALLGVGVAERSGLLSAAIRAIILGAPKNLITFAVVFAGVLSNTASEMGYVVIIPLAAAIFYALGRHPFAGLAAAFAGVSGGYSANLLIGTVDPLLAGITQEAAQLIDPEYRVHAAVNWYFMIVSTLLVTVVGTWVTARIVEPKLGAYDESLKDETVGEEMSMQPLSHGEKKALAWAGLAAAFMIGIIIYLAGPHPSNDYILPKDVTLEQARAMSVEELQSAAAEGEQLREEEVAAAEEAARKREQQAERAASDGTLSETAQPSERLRTITDDPPRFLRLDDDEDGRVETLTIELVVPAKDGLGGSINRVLLSIPGYGVLRNPETGELLNSPFLNGIVALIFIFFFVPGTVYGIAIGAVKSDRDAIDFMAAAMSSMGLYIVLVFFAAQFVAFFGWTNLGAILAVLGADGIRAIGLDNPLVFIPFILMCCVVNLMLGSASAQWAVTAPIFVPMLMQVGYSPEVIQAAYRIGDSTTNIVTPMMSYFGMIFAFACRYDKKLGIGTLIATMLPYSICMLIGWVMLFYVWVFLFGFPVGPEAPTYYPAG